MGPYAHSSHDMMKPGAALPAWDLLGYRAPLTFDAQGNRWRFIGIPAFVPPSMRPFYA